MNFSRDTFATQLGQQSNISLPSTDWARWKNDTGTLNTLLNYSYSNTNLNYRTWSPETSTLPTDLGLVVSCKIDFANGIGDDHIILVVGFLKVAGADPTINFIQASVQFHGDDSQNIMIDPIKSDPNNPTPNLEDELYNSLSEQIQGDGFGDDDTSKGRKALPDIAKANLKSMIGAVSA